MFCETNDKDWIDENYKLHTLNKWYIDNDNDNF